MAIPLISSSRTALEAVAHASFPFSTATIVADTAQFAPAIEYIQDLASNKDSASQQQNAVVRIGPQEDFGSALGSLADLAATKDALVVTALISSDYLLRALPTLDKLARENFPVVVHVLPTATGASDLADFLAIRDCGSAIICSSSIQEAHDLSIVAHLVSKQLQRPFIHLVNLFDQAQSTSQPISELSLAKATEFIQSQIKKLKDSEKSDDNDNEVPLTDDQKAISAVEVTLGLFEGSDYLITSYKGSSEARVVFTTLGAVELALPPSSPVGSLGLRLYRPLPLSHIDAQLPTTAEKVVTLEQSRAVPGVWGSLLFDLATFIQDRPTSDHRPVLVDARTVYDLASWKSSDFEALLNRVADIYSAEHLDADELLDRPRLDTTIASDPVEDQTAGADALARINKIPYSQMLKDTFKSRLNIVNGLDSTTILGPPGKDSSNPEFGFGKLAHIAHQRESYYQGAYLISLPIPMWPCPQT